MLDGTIRNLRAEQQKREDEIEELRSVTAEHVPIATGILRVLWWLLFYEASSPDSVALAYAQNCTGSRAGTVGKDFSAPARFNSTRSPPPGYDRTAYATRLGTAFPTAFCGVSTVSTSTSRRKTHW